MSIPISQILVGTVLVLGVLQVDAPKAVDPAERDLLASATNGVVSGAEARELSETAWRCGSCESCGEDKTVVENVAPMAEKTNAVCSILSCEGIPVCLGDDDQEDAEFALSEEDIRRIQDHVLSADPLAAVDVLAIYASMVDFVEARGSLQLLGCTGAIIANLPLTREQVEAVVLAQQE